MTIHDLVLHCVRKMGLSPREITERASGEFALALLAMLSVEPGKEDPNCRLLFTEDVTDQDLPRHAWIFFNGLQFDAECPEGVRNWRELPALRRAGEP